MRKDQNPCNAALDTSGRWFQMNPGQDQIGPSSSIGGRLCPAARPGLRRIQRQLQVNRLVTPGTNNGADLLGISVDDVWLASVQRS